MKRNKRDGTCVCCGKYRAIYRYHGGPARTDRHHDLCPKCWRAAMNSVRGKRFEDHYEQTRTPGPSPSATGPESTAQA